MRRFKLIIICTVIITLILSFYKITLLQVYIADKGPNFNRVLLQLPIKSGDTFSVKWTHSVSLRPVIETYKIEKNLNISIYEMIFDSFSANLPSSPDYNTIWEYNEDHIRVYNYDVTFDSLPVVIGKVVANHTLYVRDSVIPLKDIYKPGGFVKIKAIKKNLIKYVIEEAFL